MIITQQPLWNLSAGAQENKIVCQLKNEMKMVRIKTDMELVTLMMKELIENDRKFAIPMLFQI